MISDELLRRYPFFAGFSHDQLIKLAIAGDEFTVDHEHILFAEGETLSKFYLLIDGTAELSIKIPDRNAKQAKSNHITSNFITRDVSVETLGAGDIFGWSALVPPYEPTASAKALTSCRVVSFDTEMLQEKLDEDCAFGYTLMVKVAQVIRERLRGRRIELLGEQA